MKASKAKPSTPAAAPVASSTAAASKSPSPSPIDLFAAGDALAARRLARDILADDTSSEARREQARLFQERTATDRPTLCLLAIAWTVVLAIIVALFVF